MTNKIFAKISQIILGIVVFLVPLFVLPFTSEFFIFPKISLFLFGVTSAFLFWLLSQVAAKKLTLKGNLLFYPLFLIFLANLISLAANWQVAERFTAIWTILIFLFIFFFAILLVNQSFTEKKKIIKNLLFAAGLIISLLGIWFFLLPNNKYPLSFNIFGFPMAILNSSFSPTGGPLTSLVFLLTLIPFLFKDFTDFFSKEQEKPFFAKVIVKALMTLLIITGAGVFLFQIISLNKPVILPQQSGWAIALETLKTPKNALFGVGPGQFLSAFTRFKPLSLNAGDLWTMRFSSSSNELFQILTTLGLIGIAVYAFLIQRLVRQGKKGPEMTAIFLLILSMVILPSGFLSYFLLVIYLSILETKEKAEEKSYSLNRGASNVVAVIGLIISLTSLYLLGRNLSAEINFRRAIIAAGQNRGTDTYNLQIKAISQNPYRPDFHQVYSQTNLALANSLATNPPAGGLTDQDRQTITQLVQQAIREARNTAVLAPLNVGAWENLAFTYRQLVNFAQGADQWTVATFDQAIRLDPNNPQLYLDLGGFYYSLNRYDDAAGLFQVSVNLKPDFANGWYNLAAAFNQKKDYQKTFDALTQAVRLVPIDSPDYQKVQKELEEVKAKLPQPQVQKPAVGEETLTLPTPPPEPKAKITPIELPSPEATPAE